MVDGKSALELAIDFEKEGCARLLREHGATEPGTKTPSRLKYVGD
jgi:hypothetical protein